jgi:hypothetical protein
MGVGPQGRANPNQTGSGMSGGQPGRSDGRSGGPQGRANPNQTGRGGGAFNGDRDGRGDGRGPGPQGRANPNQTGYSQNGGGQQGRGGDTFQGQNVPGNPSAPGYLDYDSQMTSVGGRPVSVKDLRNDYLDYTGLGDTFADQIGNFLAGAFGFGEENPFDDPEYAGNGNPTGRGANWSFDPVPAIVGLGSTLAGIPAGPGYIASLISNELGRPLSFDLGPNALTSDTLDETGQVVGRSTTHTGPGMTVHDADNPDTFYGVSPGLGLLAGGASNAAPRKATYVGADPAPVDPAPADPYAPVTPAPTPIDTPPNDINVSPGNSGLSDQQLTDLFLSHMATGRTARGRSSGRVIV